MEERYQPSSLRVYDTLPSPGWHHQRINELESSSQHGLLRRVPEHMGSYTFSDSADIGFSSGTSTVVEESYREEPQYVRRGIQYDLEYCDSQSSHAASSQPSRRDGGLSEEQQLQLVDVLNHFCPHRDNTDARRRWINYHLVVAGVIPPESSGNPGKLLKRVTKNDLLQVWEDIGARILVRGEKREPLLFNADQLSRAIAIMEQEKMMGFKKKVSATPVSGKRRRDSEEEQEEEDCHGGKEWNEHSATKLQKLTPWQQMQLMQGKPVYCKKPLYAQ